jgi:hypothetical protein
LGLRKLNAIFSKMPDAERPDLIAVALQELPHVSMRFHTSAVQIVGEALSSTHRVFLGTVWAWLSLRE